MAQIKYSGNEELKYVFIPFNQKTVKSPGSFTLLSNIAYIQMKKTIHFQYEFIIPTININIYKSSNIMQTNQYYTEILGSSQ